MGKIKRVAVNMDEYDFIKLSSEFPEFLDVLHEAIRVQERDMSDIKTIRRFIKERHKVDKHEALTVKKIHEGTKIGLVKLRRILAEQDGIFWVGSKHRVVGKPTTKYRNLKKKEMKKKKGK